MKNRVLLSIALAVTLLMFWSREGITRKAAPPAGRTGAPPSEQTCNGSGCHSGSTLTGSITFSFGTGDTAYRPGQTYPVTITADDLSLAGVFGFEMTALDSTNTRAGTFTAINTTNTWTQIIFSRTYVGHKNATSNNTWTFNWEAPAADAGPVSFFVCVNSANNNGFASGDRIYRSSFTVPAMDLSGIDEVADGFGLTAFSSGGGKIIIRMAGAGTVGNVIALYDLSGRLISQTAAAEAEQLAVDLPVGLPSGIYLVRAFSGEKFAAAKVFVF